MDKDVKFYGSGNSVELPGIHLMTGTTKIENGVLRYKVYNPGICEIIIDIYIISPNIHHNDCLVKSRFIDIINEHNLTDIKRVVNIVSVETAESMRGEGHATELLLDFLRAYRTSKHDIVVTNAIYKQDESLDNINEFSKELSKYLSDFERFFEPFGFRSIPDISTDGCITFSNSYLFLSPKSSASKSVYKVFNNLEWGVKDE